MWVKGKRVTEEQKSGSEKTSSKKDKKPYTKPSVTSEPIYETMALACMKTPSTGPSCAGKPHNS